MPSQKKTNTIKDFEKSLARLNQLIEKMESGNLSLETALQYFEEGITLIKSCQSTLTDAEQTVHRLTEKND